MRQPAKSEPLLLHVEVEHEVLHLGSSEDHRRRPAVAGLHPLHLHERNARRPRLDVHHRVLPGHRPRVTPAIERQLDVGHRVPAEVVAQRLRVVAHPERRHRLHCARHGRSVGRLRRQGLGERVHQRAVHVGAEQGVGKPRAEHHAAGGERALRYRDAGVPHFDEPGRDVVCGAAALGDERRVRHRLRELRPRDRAAAKDGHARAAGGEAKEEPVGDLLRGRHLRRQRQAGGREPGHARGAPGQRRQELARRARRQDPDVHLAHRLVPVGGVGCEPGVEEAPGGARACDRVGWVRRARLVVRVAAAAGRGAARGGVGVGEEAGGAAARDLRRRLAALARGPDERAGDVEDEAGAVVEGDCVEGSGGVLGDRSEHRKALARRQRHERGGQDEEEHWWHLSCTDGACNCLRVC
uniref:Uncharacterized protein n=1 Tax=Triticum urartu TaxID=4572 RepID=A0A8R7U2B8_TRIUA